MGTGRCGSFEEYSRKCSSAPEAQEEISRWRNPKASTHLLTDVVFKGLTAFRSKNSLLQTKGLQSCVDTLGFHHRLISTALSGPTAASHEAPKMWVMTGLPKCPTHVITNRYQSQHVRAGQAGGLVTFVYKTSNRDG